jgi:flavin-dependent dehydrogenase
VSWARTTTSARAMTTDLNCDVAVVGGGPAGAIAALIVARTGHRVVCASGHRAPVGEALGPGARRALMRLGLWDSWSAFAAGAARPCFGNESAWGTDELAARSFLFEPDGYGWHIDRTVFEAWLARQAAAAGAEVIERRVVGCHDRGHVVLELERASERPARIISRAVIDGSGRRAFVARSLGARPRVLDRLIGVVGFFDAHPMEEATTLVEAAPDGWWYCAPAPDDRLVAIFMTDADLWHARARPQAWFDELARTRHVRNRVGSRRPARGPAVVAAATQRTPRPTSSTLWLAVGDAALAVDPLSSSGLLRAIETGEAAGYAITALLRGERRPAEAYERQLDAAFDLYLRERELFYALETRWPERAFWERRATRRPLQSKSSRLNRMLDDGPTSARGHEP